MRVVNSIKLISQVSEETFYREILIRRSRTFGWWWLKYSNNLKIWKTLNMVNLFFRGKRFMFLITSVCVKFMDLFSPIYPLDPLKISLIIPNPERIVAEIWFYLCIPLLSHSHRFLLTSSKEQFLDK